MFTYAEVGATRDEVLPRGYHHLRYRTVLGGPEAMAPAARAVLTFAAQRAIGVRMDAAGPRAVPGLRVTSGLGFANLRVQAPCEVVWVEDTAERAGFAYGTLAGHPECGEESFLVELVDGRTWFSVTAFSRPALWYTRLGSYGVVGFQHLYARLLARALRRITAA
ncbi:hypothetical protein Cs7R123_20220 [Catellatospora sp. TT07R-123]|uniref:DUF1990 family protein n=1 Tax=Catellatospora sp. TT07R-123 TaxID=2733863 RepID=UPI001B286344|nr:DUF1990 domain-containing protein [Catellatospora sp. TT07R-123]GHJ44680.1 hypothetical protein Cs7R123_20220 [Catellatospora sp. TT07R-123]